MSCGIRATIPAKIIIETPLLIPLTVIISPSQVTNIVPAVKTNAINKYVEIPGLLINP